MANNISQTKWAEHIRNCSDFSKEIALRMDLRDDAARNACFATILISANQHGLFVEPVPRDTMTPVMSLEAAAAKLNANAKSVETTAAAKDQKAAEKADEQIKDVPRNATEDQSNGQRRTSFLAGIQSARELLNKEGFTPPITPAGLNKIINDDLNFPGNLGTLDVDQLEKVTMHLSQKLDTFRANKKALEADAPF